MGKKFTENSISPLSKKSRMTYTVVSYFFIIILTILFYGISVLNQFALDDFYVTAGNKQTAQGIKAIPEIFNSFYAYDNGQSYGYRPLVRSSFAIEYEFFKGAPDVGHIINVLLYLLGIFILFRLLKKYIFKDKHPLIPLGVILIFMAYPLHTEVVASLKNRDEILCLIFCSLAALSFFKWTKNNKIINLIGGLLLFAMGVFCKMTALSFIFVFPLMLYFFSDISKNKLILLSGLVLVTGLLFAAGPYLYLGAPDRTIEAWENPLIEANFWEYSATVVYILGFYIKKLFYPYPMLFYYGFDTIPVTNWADPIVWLITIALGFLIYFAIKGLTKKNIWSFIILSFFGLIAMYSNIGMPVPGIVGDRFLFYASLPFAMFIVLGLEYLLKSKLNLRKNLSYFIMCVVLVGILIPYGLLDVKRSNQWRNNHSLFRSDIPKLKNSVRAHYLYATSEMEKVKANINKAINPLKFIRYHVDTAIVHFEQVLKMYPNHATTWENLANIYGKLDKDWEKATHYYLKTLELDPNNGRVMFNLGIAYENLNKLDSAMLFLNKASKIDDSQINCKSRIANLHYKMGDIKKAFRLNRDIMKNYPDNELPYINLGNYCINVGDTNRGVIYYRRALKLSYSAEVALFLYDYHLKKGEENIADYYYSFYEKNGRKRF
ncbi:MAG: tetratricopeptide repeat protein [Bacteroidales bacterium]